MLTPEERWWSVRSGEYVLGTLRGLDLVLFERILSSDTTMQAEVVGWERRLSGLRETTQAMPVAEHVWPKVLDRVRALSLTSVEKAPAGPGAPTDVAHAPRSRPIDIDVESEQDDRSPLWPTLTALATAASLLLGLLLYRGTTLPDVAPLRTDGVAVVLSDENGEPYFLVETDYEGGRVRVTALSPPALDEDRNFQLWQALPDRSAVRPVTLLPEEAGRSRTFEIETLIEGSDLFGVSLEPDDAPTDGGPTGPVFAHGDFLMTRDDH